MNSDEKSIKCGVYNFEREYLCIAVKRNNKNMNKEVKKKWRRSEYGRESDDNKRYMIYDLYNSEREGDTLFEVSSD